MSVLRVSSFAKLRRVFDHLGALRQDRSGNMAVIAALTAVPLVMAAGIAVDYTRAA
jgi:Flp pilus assembly protein TadG